MEDRLRREQLHKVFAQQLLRVRNEHRLAQGSVNRGCARSQQLVLDRQDKTQMAYSDTLSLVISCVFWRRLGES